MHVLYFATICYPQISVRATCIDGKFAADGGCIEAKNGRKKWNSFGVDIM